MPSLPYGIGTDLIINGDRQRRRSSDGALFAGAEGQPRLIDASLPGPEPMTGPPASGNGSASSDDDARLQPASWMPPASRSPWPRGPRPTAAPDPQIRRMGGVMQSMEPGGLSDGPGVMNEFGGLLAEVRYAGIGSCAQQLRQHGFKVGEPRPSMFEDTNHGGITVRSFRFNDPQQTTFYVLPTFTDPSPNYFTLVSVRRGGRTWFSTTLKPNSWRPAPPPIPPRGVPLRNTTP